MRRSASISKVDRNHKVRLRDVLTGVTDPLVRRVLTSRSLVLVASPIILYIVATTRPPEEQGFYFVFANVQAIAGVFEYGVGTMTVQVMAHEAVDFSPTTLGNLAVYPSQPASFFGGLTAFRRWYRYAAWIVSLVLLPAGLWFFSRLMRPNGCVLLSGHGSLLSA